MAKKAAERKNVTKVTPMRWLWAFVALVFLIGILPAALTLVPEDFRLENVWKMLRWPSDRSTDLSFDHEVTYCVNQLQLDPFESQVWGSSDVGAAERVFCTELLEKVVTYKGRSFDDFFYACRSDAVSAYPALFITELLPQTEHQGIDVSATDAWRNEKSLGGMCYHWAIYSEVEPFLAR